MTGSISRRATLGSGLAAAALPSAARTQRNAIRIGVLTDMAGQNAANTGPGSVVGAQRAVEDFARRIPTLRSRSSPPICKTNQMSPWQSPASGSIPMASI
jgi:hypothetical protein